MSTLSAIKDAVMEVRDFLRREMTPAFMASVQSALKAINKVLNDPEVQQSVKEGLIQLKVILNKVNDSNIVENISNILVDIHNILDKIDPEIIKNILASINNLFSGKKALQDVYEKLKSVHCLRDLKDVGNMLIHPSAALALGVYAPLIGMAITAAVKITLTKENNPKLIDSIKELTAVNQIALLESLNSSRLNAIAYLIGFQDKERNPDYVATPLENQFKIECQNTMNSILPLSHDSQLLIKRIQTDYEKILQKLYQPKIDNENITDYLDSIESSMYCWEQLLEFVIYSSQLIGKNERPKLPRDTLNYAQIKRLYSSAAVDKVMHTLLKRFEDNGGNDLFSKLANSFENSPQGFLQCSILVSTNEPHIIPESEWSVQAEVLSEYYSSAGEDVTNLWEMTAWERHGYSEPPLLTQRVAKIIISRAYLQFAYQTAPSFFVQNNIPREIYNATLDVPRGLIQTVIHPINTLKGLGSLFTATGWKSIGSKAVNHPVRFFGSVALGAAAGYGASKFYHVPTHSPKNIRSINISHNTISHKISLSTSTSSVSPSSSILNATAPSKSMDIKDVTKYQMVSTGSLNLAPNITDEMFNKLLEQIAVSKNPKLTYCEWYEKEVCGKKVSVLAMEYKKKLRLIEASDFKRIRLTSSTIEQVNTKKLVLFPETQAKKKGSVRKKMPPVEQVIKRCFTTSNNDSKPEYLKLMSIDDQKRFNGIDEIISKKVGCYGKEDYSSKGYLVNKELRDISYRVKKVILNMPSDFKQIKVDKAYELFVSNVLILKVNNGKDITSKEMLLLNKIKSSAQDEIEKSLSSLDEIQKDILYSRYNALEHHRQRCILAAIDDPNSQLYHALNMKQRSLFGISLTLFSGSNWNDIINGDSSLIKELKQFDIKHLRQVEYENSPDYFVFD